MSHPRWPLYTVSQWIRDEYAPGVEFSDSPPPSSPEAFSEYIAAMNNGDRPVKQYTDDKWSSSAPSPDQIPSLPSPQEQMLSSSTLSVHSSDQIEAPS